MDTSPLSPWWHHFDWRDAFLLWLTPVFLLAIAVEWWHWRQAKRPEIFTWQDSFASLNLGSVYAFVDVAVVLAFVLPAMDWLYTHRLFTFQHSPLDIIALYLGVEFCYYWFHRCSHRIRWFWCAHVVHHASEHMNFTTALRQSWLYGFAGNWLFYTPMVWLGFEPRWVLLALSVNLAFQFFVHTQWVGKLPRWVEFVFNTPSHHRVHHGRNPAYIDRNYGGTLIVFDRLFGTFTEESEAPDYGLVHPLLSYNLIWLTIHEWVAMGKDIARPGPLSQRLKHLWAPPGWAREAPRQDNPAHATSSPP